MHRFPLRTLIATTGLVLFSLSPSHAQFGGGGAPQTGLGSESQRLIRGNRPAAPRAPEPAAIPGTRGPGSEAAPATQAPATLSPTDALFDAINRGDAAAARDAVNRGANLEAHNLLGLTPLELSVDLGRNTISFLLLSLRGEDTSLGRDGDRRGRSATRAAGRAPRVAAAPSRAAPAAAPVPVPRVYSGNGGTPIPNAGFLGFNGGRSVQ